MVFLQEKKGVCKDFFMEHFVFRWHENHLLCWSETPNSEPTEPREAQVIPPVHGRNDSTQLDPSCCCHCLAWSLPLTEGWSLVHVLLPCACHFIINDLYASRETLGQGWGGYHHDTRCKIPTHTSACLPVDEPTQSPVRCLAASCVFALFAHGQTHPHMPAQNPTAAVSPVRCASETGFFFFLVILMYKHFQLDKSGDLLIA